MGSACCHRGEERREDERRTEREHTRAREQIKGQHNRPNSSDTDGLWASHCTEWSEGKDERVSVSVCVCRLVSLDRKTKAGVILVIGLAITEACYKQWWHWYEWEHVILRTMCVSVKHLTELWIAIGWQGHWQHVTWEYNVNGTTIYLSAPQADAPNSEGINGTNNLSHIPAKKLTVLLQYCWRLTYPDTILSTQSSLPR